MEEGKREKGKEKEKNGVKEVNRVNVVNEENERTRIEKRKENVDTTKRSKISKKF